MRADVLPDGLNCFDFHTTAFFKPPDQTTVTDCALAKRRRRDTNRLGSSFDFQEKGLSSIHAPILIGYSLFVNRPELNRQLDCNLPGRCPMNDTLRRNLERLLLERQEDMKAASLGAGLNETAVFEILKKKKDPKFSTLVKLSQHLKVSIHELANGATPATTPRSVSVTGETAAGVWLEPDTWDDAKYPPVPFVPDRYADLEQRAYRVIGPSMNAAGIHDGTFVITVAYWDVRTQPQDGDIVVVEQKRDGGLVQRTLKQVFVKPDRIELAPRSTDERYQEPLVIPRATAPAHDTKEIMIIALVIGTYSPIGR